LCEGFVVEIYSGIRLAKFYHHSRSSSIRRRPYSGDGDAVFEVGTSSIYAGLGLGRSIESSIAGSRAGGGSHRGFGDSTRWEARTGTRISVGDAEG
jgi:hypothetical protein